MPGAAMAGGVSTTNARFVITGRSINQLYSFKADFDGAFVGDTPMEM
jgi:hypothetical protein